MLEPGPGFAWSTPHTVAARRRERKDGTVGGSHHRDEVLAKRVALLDEHLASHLKRESPILLAQRFLPNVLHPGDEARRQRSIQREAA